jgi:hypothetical protein
MRFRDDHRGGFRRTLPGIQRQSGQPASGREERGIRFLYFEDPLQQIDLLALPKFDAPRVYGEVSYTVACIASILQSNPKVSYAVIIADDASADDSAKAVCRVETSSVSKQPTNLSELCCERRRVR